MSSQDAGAPPPNLRPLANGGLRLRIAATVGTVALAGLSVAQLASASFDESSVPIGDVASLDGIVSGIVRLSGDRLVFYSGDRFRSNQSNLAVNFASGGSLVLCPHSQVQILAANQHAGVMIAFAEGGSEQPFPMHPNDIVMTPDWRIEMLGDVHPGDLGVLQLSTTRRGDLCLSGTVQTGSYFHISQLVGDTAFNFPGQGSVRIVGGRIDDNPAGCACDGGTPANSASNAIQPAVTVIPARPATSSTTAVAAPSVSSALANPAPQPKKHQRPQDVAGYVRSFVHLLFGR